MKNRKKLKLKKMTIGQLTHVKAGNYDLLGITARETSPILCNYAYTTNPRCNLTVRLTFVDC